MSKDFILTTSKNNKLRITASGMEKAGDTPCIIFVHGFKGFKDWGHGPYLSKYFADRGYFVLRFNFSHNGTGDSLTEFTELDKFSENTFSLEVSELSELIDAYNNDYFCKVNNRKTGLLGHSRGGAITLLTAYLKKDKVNAAAVWASTAKLDRYSERQKEKWRRVGFFDVMNSRTKQVMRLSSKLLDDIEINKDGILNIERAVKKLELPLFIGHGEQDLAVPVDEAEMIYEWSDKGITELLKIPQTGHTFDIKHPFEGTNNKFDLLTDKTIEFFNKTLIRGNYGN